MRPHNIHTERLVLRFLRTDDAAWIAREISNPNVHQWLTNPPSPYTLNDAVSFVLEHEMDPRYRTIQAAGKPVGVISIDPDLGYWIAEDYWGNGYMTEAAYGLLHNHFSHGGEVVESGWLVGNQRSQAVLEKLGFKRIDPVIQRSEFHDREMTVERVELNNLGDLLSIGREISASISLPYLKTERLRTRPLTTADMEKFRQFAGCRDVASMTASIPTPFSLDEAEDWLALRGWNNPPGFVIAVTKKDGTLVGSIGCGSAPDCDIGYIIDPSHARRGYATEILAAATNALFAENKDQLELNACVFKDNPASARVLNKCGFERVGECVSTARARLEPAANWQYRLTRDAWKETLR